MHGMYYICSGVHVTMHIMCKYVLVQFLRNTALYILYRMVSARHKPCERCIWWVEPCMHMGANLVMTDEEVRYEFRCCLSRWAWFIHKPEQTKAARIDIAMRHGRTSFYGSLKNFYYSHLQFLSVSCHVRNKTVCEHALFKSMPAVVRNWRAVKVH